MVSSSTAPTSTSGATSHSFLPRKPSLFRRDRSRNKDASGADLPPRSSTPQPRSVTPVPPIDESDAVSSTSPPHRGKHSSRHSFASSVADFGSNLRRSASLRSSSSNSAKEQPLPSSSLAQATLSPEKPTFAANASSNKLLATFTRGRQKSYDASAAAAVGKPPDEPRTPGMANTVGAAHMWASRPSGTAHSNLAFGQVSNPLAAPANIPPVPSAAGGHNPHAVFQHIHDMSSKRISTLDYLRKAHDGRVYWFNTLLFNKTDLNKLPYFSQKTLSKRATNYLLLGFSLPTILDLNSNSAADYLRALNALLIEFETYQSIHPPDGSMPSSLGRGRVAGMFKRATHAASGAAKGRRQSSATEIGLMEVSDASSAPMLPSGEHSDHLLPGEEYTHLMTPHLPFEPDFFETFSTLCDVLIDCYTKIMGLVNGPETCGPGVGELFAKADARVRKIIVAGVVREFEDASRSGVKQEVAGVGKVVLGGLM
ncbi:uncharacterized protein BKCO1_8700030 [Diplodia corticola]|uniref:Uncharacterized protein n=1 Tax=Diplodia corticola TaxID=236234 RepID=A0A1J9RNP8_9PEZI|nr:uncharacterized protein BKCO1_8700030 [Diplodia corticola]OJD29213.1 hypothetical protein BKCO1_8700030 [Diplodia corticola]